MNVALCCTACKEQYYIKEFVEHYILLGFDKIFIYDNNDKDDNDIYNGLSSLSDKQMSFIEIIDKRGLKLTQVEEYLECYNTYGNKYDWICYFDVDEFLELPKHGEIHKFLNQNKFNKYNLIRINWVIYNDNNLIYNNSHKVKEVFTTPAHDPHLFYYNVITKCILRTGIKNLQWDMRIPYSNAHTPKYNTQIFACDTNGVITNRDEAATDKILLDEAYLKHYRFKSISEFMFKKLRGFADFKGYPSKLNWKQDIKEFFTVNELTLDKLNFIFENFDLTLKKDKYTDFIKRKHNVAIICTHKNHIDIAPFIIDYWKKIKEQIHLDAYVFDNGSDDGSLENFAKYDWIHVTDISQYTGGKLNDILNVTIKNSVWKQFKANYDYVICCDFDECPYCEDWDSVLTKLDELNASLIYPKHCNMIDDEFKKYEEGKLYHELNPYCEDLNKKGIVELRRTNRCYIINPKTVEDINYLPGQEFCYPIAENMTPYYVNNIYMFHLHYIGNVYATKINEQNMKEMDSDNKKMGYGYHYFNNTATEMIDKMLKNKIKYNEVIYPSYKTY